MMSGPNLKLEMGLQMGISGPGLGHRGPAEWPSWLACDPMASSYYSSQLALGWASKVRPQAAIAGPRAVVELPLAGVRGGARLAQRIGHA